MAKDQFADLLGGLKSKTASSEAKLSLEERQKMSQSSLDFGQLSGNSSSFGSSQGSSGPGSGNGSARGSAQTRTDHLFEGFDLVNAGTGSVSHSRPTGSSQQDLFEGFGGSSSSTPAGPAADDFSVLLGEPVKPQSVPQTAKAQQKHDIDDLFAVFDTKPAPSEPASARPPLQQPRPVPAQAPGVRGSSLLRDQQGSAGAQADNSADAGLDEALASLLDMGFSLEQSRDALNHTSSGRDVQQAINYIMTAAHNKSRTKAGLPPQQLASSRSSSSGTPSYMSSLASFTHMVTDISDKLMNDVSNKLFAPPPTTDSPAWMRNQQRYMKRASFEQDPAEISAESLGQLKLDSRAPNPAKFVNDDDILPRRQRNRAPVAPASRQTRPQARHAGSSTKTLTEELDIFASAPPAQPEKAQPEETLLDLSAPQPQTAQRQFVQVGQLEMITFKEFREKGGESFKRGDFVLASEQYQQSLQALPANHLLRIIAYSNCITALLKTGEYKKCVEYADQAIELIGESKGANEFVEEGKPMKEFWIKVTQKKAQALEHLEKYKAALETYTLLIENGGANKVSLEGKRRCQDVLSPAPKPAKPVKPVKPRAESSKPSQPARDDYEAVKRVRAANKADESLEQAKFKLHDEVEEQINAWKQGKEDNLRALLSSLETVLEPQTNWKPVAMSELVLPKRVKLVYMKAVAKTHPDKIPQNASPKTRMVSETVFVVINKAWEVFKQQNNLT